MGYELRRQLREALGPQVTGLQRAVALEIADDANNRTRRSVVPLEDLVRWTGAKDATVIRNALKRLAAAGWEFRVPIGEGKDGRPLFAVPGRRMTFVVPPFKGGAGATPSPSKGGATATPSDGQGGAGATPSDGSGAPPSAGQGFPQDRQNPEQGVATAPPSRGSHGSPLHDEGVATAPPSGEAARDVKSAGQPGNYGPADAEQGVATAPPSGPQGVAPAPPSSTTSQLESKQAGRQSLSRRDIPDAALPLVDALSANGVIVRWPWKGHQWFPVLALIADHGVPAMVDHAIKAASRTTVESAKYFMHGWAELPPLPSPDAPRPALRSVTPLSKADAHRARSAEMLARLKAGGPQ